MVRTFQAISVKWVWAWCGHFCIFSDSEEHSLLLLGSITIRVWVCVHAFVLLYKNIVWSLQSETATHSSLPMVRIRWFGPSFSLSLCYVTLPLATILCYHKHPAAFFVTATPQHYIKLQNALTDPKRLATPRFRACVVCLWNWCD